MSYWILKTEPEEYAWETLEQDKQTQWSGVRNFEARKYLSEMKPGDIAFIYHSGQERIIMGLAKLVSKPYPDPSADKGDWLAVDIEQHKALVRPVSLEEIRNTHGLSVMPLVTHARLSVHPVTDVQAAMILKIAKTKM